MLLINHTNSWSDSTNSEGKWPCTLRIIKAGILLNGLHGLSLSLFFAFCYFFISVSLFCFVLSSYCFIRSLEKLESCRVYLMFVPASFPVLTVSFGFLMHRLFLSCVDTIMIARLCGSVKAQLQRAPQSPLVPISRH